jgi:L-lysine 6-transaminase
MNYTIDIEPKGVDHVLKKHILKDGMDLVMDLERSHGVYIYDSLHNRDLLDFFSCFATIPLGYNHPKMINDEAFKHNLLQAALANPTNSDIYTTQYAHFIETFGRVGIPPYLKYAFFVAGGSLALENAFKVAMDWKVQKNFAKGYRQEVGHSILHFQEAFHGRSGYTLSVTNTDPAKTRHFTKFDWPRVLNPKIVFPYTDERYDDLLKREQLAIAQIRMAFAERKDDICAIVIEPVQSEGGDNHFRTEFFEQLRTICDENEAMLIYDEVQTGVGMTGKFWAHEHFGAKARPDIVAFGKKMQVCGILANERVDEVEHNCFNTPSRINSTWGGNLVDMVRVDRILEIIEEDHLLEHVEKVGTHLSGRLQELEHHFPALVSNSRGLGLVCAFDLPNTATRNAFIKRGLEHNVLFLGCGERSIRFRPSLIITEAEIDKGIAVAIEVLKELA